MINKYITKTVIAVALTLAITIGSTFVGNELGLNLTPTASACVISSSSGGGC